MKFSGYKYMFLLASIVLWTTGCKPTVSVVKPVESYVEKQKHKKQLSFISVPLEVPVSEIEAQINKYLTGVLYEDKSFSNNDGDNLKCVVKKYAPFKLYAAENRLLITMPLDITGSYTKLGAVVNFKGTLKANYMTTVTLLDGWKIKTVTKSYGYDWIKKPEVDLGWVELPVKWLVDKILDGQEDKINTSIDDAVQEYVDLKELAQPAFAALAEPMNVSEDYNCWFRIEPVEAFITPLNFQEQSLAMTIGLQAYTETFIGRPEKPDTVKVVPLRVSNQLPGDFNMELVTVMPYEEASEVMHNEFVKSGYEYVDGKYHLTFTKMSMFGHEGKIVIEVGMLGSVKGEIYMVGEPYYDSIGRNIRLKNLEYDFRSKQALLKSADWLAHGALCKMMEKHMYFEIGEELDAAKKEAEEYLEEYQPVTGVTINGKLDNLETSDIYLIKDALVVVVNAKGSLSIKVKGLE